MADTCTHLDTIRHVTPNTDGCEECLKMGAEWVHLRLCLTCGHVGCCDSSRYKHATKHFHGPSIQLSNRSSPAKAGNGAMSTKF